MTSSRRALSIARLNRANYSMRARDPSGLNNAQAPTLLASIDIVPGSLIAGSTAELKLLLNIVSAGGTLFVKLQYDYIDMAGAPGTDEVIRGFTVSSGLVFINGHYNWTAEDLTPFDGESFMFLRAWQGTTLVFNELNILDGLPINGAGTISLHYFWSAAGGDFFVWQCSVDVSTPTKLIEIV